MQLTGWRRVQARSNMSGETTCAFVLLQEISVEHTSELRTHRVADRFDLRSIGARADTSEHTPCMWSVRAAALDDDLGRPRRRRDTRGSRTVAVAIGSSREALSVACAEVVSSGTGSQRLRGTWRLSS